MMSKELATFEIEEPAVYQRLRNVEEAQWAASPQAGDEDEDEGSG